MAAAAGLAAISASTLVGAELLNVDAFSYFRGRAPLAVINHPLFVYAVPERAPAGLDKAAQAAFLNGRVLRHVRLDCALVLALGEARPWLNLGPPVYRAAGYQVTGTTLILRWRVKATPPPPVSTFAHLDKADGSLAAAYDAGGAGRIQAGDVIGRRYTLEPLPPPGDYQLVVGLYALEEGGPRYSTIPLTAGPVP